MQGDYTSTAGGEAMDPAGSLSLWRTIRCRKFRIAFCGLLFLALAIGYHQTSGPWYESTAQVLVLKKHLETAPISGPNVVERPTEEYLPTHMLIRCGHRDRRNARSPPVPDRWRGIEADPRRWRPR